MWLVLLSEEVQRTEGRREEGEGGRVSYHGNTTLPRQTAAAVLELHY